VKTAKAIALEESKTTLIITIVVEVANTDWERGSVGQHKKTPCSNTEATQSATR
jgi:hypothetical protein